MKRAMTLAAAFVFFALALGCRKTERGAAVPRELTVLSSHDERIIGFFLAEFARRTGIKAVAVRSGTGDLLTRLRKGEISGDVFWGGGAESLEANRDLFSAYRSPELAMIDPAFCSKDGSWTGFSLLPFVIAYNPRILPAGQEPGRWSDILGERFRGRIAYADPGRSGSAYTILRVYLYARTGSFSGVSARDRALSGFCRALDGHLLPESTQVPRAVSSGESLIGLIYESAVVEDEALGSDLRIIYPLDGTCAVPDGVAMLRSARNSEKAAKFIDFVLGRDAAAILAGRYRRRSARIDAPTPPGLPPLSRMKLLDYDWAEAARSQEESLAAFRDAMDGASGTEGTD